MNQVASPVDALEHGQIRSSDGTGSHTVGEHTRPAYLVEPSMVCAELERILADRSDLESVLVIRDDGAPPLMLTRRYFSALMVGRLGYGYALWSRRTVEALELPEAMVLAAAVDIEDAAEAAFRRPEHWRFDDVAIQHSDGSFSTLSVAKLFERLAHARAARAMHDPLTGLANRALFVALLEKAMSRRRPTHIEGPSVLFVDVDEFKSVNDSLGHAAGDQLLRGIAERLLTSVRATDTVARLGGDEFVVMVEGGNQLAEEVTERIRSRFTEPFVLATAEMAVPISVSIGIAEHESGIEAEALIQRADLAMYAAKRGGKGRKARYEPQMHGVAIERLNLRVDLRMALARGELYLDYQPIAAVTDQRVVGIESLLRWQHPKRGLVAPDEFIGLAEREGLIRSIGRWVLEEACGFAADLHRLGDNQQRLCVNVNVSPVQLESGGLVDEIRSALDLSGIDATHLVVELTEQSLLHNVSGTARQLHQIRDLGVRVAVDDFGAGFSSLAHLQRFPVDVIKLDRAFISSLGAVRGNLDVMRGIVKLAEELDVKVIAEGVETGDQLAYLERIRCRYAQGFYLARPQRPAAIRELVCHQAAQPDRSPA